MNTHPEQWAAMLQRPGNVYAPNIGYERVLFFLKLQEAMNNIPRENCIIVAGDFNCTLDHTVDRNHDEPHLNSAEALKKVIMFHSLVDVWRESFPKSRQYTWLKINSNIISGARLDRIYVQKGRRGRFFDSKINPTPISDHYYVSVMVTISNTIYKSYWHFNNSLLHDCTFISFLLESLEREKDRV